MVGCVQKLIAEDACRGKQMASRVASAIAPLRKRLQRREVPRRGSFPRSRRSFAPHRKIGLHPVEARSSGALPISSSSGDHRRGHPHGRWIFGLWRRAANTIGPRTRLRSPAWFRVGVATCFTPGRYGCTGDLSCPVSPFPTTRVRETWIAREIRSMLETAALRGYGSISVAAKRATYEASRTTAISRQGSAIVNSAAD
jgi:hypothetical protein